MSRRAHQKLAHRQAILAAAEHAMGVHGDVAVDEIAARAGLAKGTVYNYFHDKEALLETVSRAVEERVLDQIAQASVGVRTPQARLATALCVLLQLALQEPGQARILRRRMNSGRAVRIGLHELMAGELQVMASHGALNAADAAPALALVSGAARAAMKQVLANGDARRLDEAIALLSLSLRALACDADNEMAAAWRRLSSVTDVVHAPLRLFS